MQGSAVRRGVEEQGILAGPVPVPALAACLEAAAMRNVPAFYSGRPVQAHRLSLVQFRSYIAHHRREPPEGGGERDSNLDGFARLWEGYLAHGRRQLACARSGRVILAPSWAADTEWRISWSDVA
jgi:hypothetical protein